MSECVVCTSPAGDIYLLCMRCGDSLADDLADVPDLCDELEVTRTRQDRIGGGNAGRRNAERPLPWKEPASEAAFVLHDTLAAEARELAEHRGVELDAATTAELAVWLRNRIDWLRAAEGIEETFGAILYAVRTARRAVDRPAVLPYAGRCHECREHMYARMDRPKVYCRACDHEHDTEQLRQYLLRAVEHKNLTVAELAASLPALLGKPLPLATIKKWVSRGQLFRAGRDERGTAVYRIHDVVQLAMFGPTRGNGSAA